MVRSQHHNPHISPLAFRPILIVFPLYLCLFLLCLGRAIIRTENPVFQEHNAIDMALDCLCERGYTVVLDLTRKTRADRVNMKTGNFIYGIQLYIECR